MNLAAAIFWRLHKLDEQEQPRVPNIHGSVDVQLKLDTDSNLLWVRTASRSANPELARALVEAVSRWTFVGLKMTSDFATKTISPDNGDPIATSSTLTFTFP